MARTPKNHGKDWSPSDMQQLKREVKQNTPTRVLALHLGRTAAAVQQKASTEGISLKPTNQSPYGTKKK
ncbi:MAG: hypothetical protein U1F54_04625 [Burkholderiales bacterium]